MTGALPLPVLERKIDDWIAAGARARPFRHCERSEAIQCGVRGQLDCRVASLLAMTANIHPPYRLWTTSVVEREESP